ncbi:MAG TPA: GNAT family N-acetyltransferase [Tepidisphaeraceae bacterium]|nr:GNAT family N-acetyltransferase [Tepidisphaeraceae bacterium]
MASLSNFFRPRDPGAGPGFTPVYRPVQRQEIESALRLILADGNGLASDEAVLDFLAFALQRKIDVNEIWVAIVDDHIVWALLPIISPGRTMLLFTPNRLPLGTPPSAARELTDQVCAHWQKKNVNLAQLLLDPSDENVQELYVACGFEMLAELIYLQKSVFEPLHVAFPAGFEIVHYSAESHTDFARAILHSYEQSLDCPRLNGRRDIQDVIAGHKASGIFEPNLWHLLRENGQNRGVLILSPSPHNESVELVYLGIAPEARGRGIGTLLLRHALNAVHGTGRKELTLAVDALNTPALKLYYRHGMKRIASRMALIRELKPATVVSQ